jgi:cell wall-associated NlpC family hydrolase
MRSSTRVLLSVALATTIGLAGLSGPAAAQTSVVDRGDRVLAWAKKLQGKPYKWGAAGPTRFDCSGYVQYVYGKAGKKIGRTSGDQLAGQHIAKGKKRPGDILVFLRGGKAFHSAIYAGGGKMWEAQRTGVPVAKHTIWWSTYVVRRPAGQVVTTRTESGKVDAKAATTAPRR